MTVKETALFVGDASKFYEVRECTNMQFMTNKVSACAVLGVLSFSPSALNTDGLSLFVPFDRKLRGGSSSHI